MTEARHKNTRRVSRAQWFAAIECQIEAIRNHAFRNFTPDELDRLGNVIHDISCELWTAADLERGGDNRGGAA